MCGFRGILWRGPEFLSAVSGGLAVTTWGIDKVVVDCVHVPKLELYLKLVCL